MKANTEGKFDSYDIKKQVKLIFVLLNLKRLRFFKKQ